MYHISKNCFFIYHLSQIFHLLLKIIYRFNDGFKSRWSSQRIVVDCGGKEQVADIDAEHQVSAAGCEKVKGRQLLTMSFAAVLS
jgi:hypothetical protein